MANRTCGKEVGQGAVMYLCRLEGGHEGPCVAPEIGSSQIARRKWERQQQSADNGAAMDPVVAHEPVVEPEAVVKPSPEPLPIEPHEEYAGVVAPTWNRTHDDRVALAMEELVRPFEELAPAVRSWVRGAQAQLALLELWEAAENGPITLSREDLAGLVPEYLR